MRVTRLESAAGPGAAAETWIESSFDVDGHRFGVSVRRLDDRERQRTAAEIAWFAHGLVSPEVDLEAIGWTMLLQQILSECVAITADEDALDRLESLWNQVICRALDAFVQVNELDPVLRRYLHEEPACVS
jgi:hypothetical protein